jgi:hypothetical protein
MLGLRACDLFMFYLWLCSEVLYYSLCFSVRSSCLKVSISLVIPHDRCSVREAGSLAHGLVLPWELTFAWATEDVLAVASHCESDALTGACASAGAGAGSRASAGMLDVGQGSAGSIRMSVFGRLNGVAVGRPSGCRAARDCKDSTTVTGSAYGYVAHKFAVACKVCSWYVYRSLVLHSLVALNLQSCCTTMFHPHPSSLSSLPHSLTFRPPVYEDLTRDHICCTILICIDV